MNMGPCEIPEFGSESSLLVNYVLPAVEGLLHLMLTGCVLKRKEYRVRTMEFIAWPSDQLLEIMTTFRPNTRTGHTSVGVWVIGYC